MVNSNARSGDAGLVFSPRPQRRGSGASGSASATPSDRVRTRWLSQASCAVWGHHVDNHAFERARAARGGAGAASCTRGGSIARAGAAHPLMLSRPPHVQATHRSERLSRLRVRAMRPPAVVPRSRRPVRRAADIPEESPLPLRAVRPSRRRRGDPRRLRGVRVSLRAHVPARPLRSPDGTSPHGLRAVRTSDQIRDEARRVHGVRVPRLRSSVLLRRSAHVAKRSIRAWRRPRWPHSGRNRGDMRRLRDGAGAVDPANPRAGRRYDLFRSARQVLHPYSPPLPNFLVGRILLDRNPAMAASVSSTRTQHNATHSAATRSYRSRAAFGAVSLRPQRRHRLHSPRFATPYDQITASAAARMRPSRSRRL